MNLNNNQLIKVSIVVPVFNVQRYLSECIDSLINQTYQNIEIILVDDGSTDGSSKICDSYLNKDFRIVVFHKENEGSAAARIDGMQFVTGEYTLFVDSDDWLDAQTINDLVTVVNKTNQSVDCVIFSYLKEKKNNKRTNHVFDSDQDFSASEGENLVYRRLFGPLGMEMSSPEKLDYLSSCCFKLYKTEFARKGKQFSSQYVGTGEDGLFNIYALKDAKYFVYIDKPYYHYRSNPTSLTSIYKPNFVSLWNNLFNEYWLFINENNLDERYKKALYNRISLSIVGIGFNELNSYKSIWVKIKNIRKYIKSDSYRDAIKNADIKYLPTTWKVLLLSAKMKFALILYIILSIGKKKTGN